MTDLASFIAQLHRRAADAADAADADFAISYRTIKGGYVGIYAIPGDAQFRQCVTPSGKPRVRDTYQEAEADAGHALVDLLQRMKAGLTA